MYRRSKVFVGAQCVLCGERARRLGWCRLCDVCRGILSTFYVWFAWFVDLEMSQEMGLSPGGSIEIQGWLGCHEV